MMFTQHVTGSFDMLSSQLHALLGQIILLLLKANDITCCAPFKDGSEGPEDRRMRT